MNNFIYENKTKVYFGTGGVKEYYCCNPLAISGLYIHQTHTKV